MNTKVLLMSRFSQESFRLKDIMIRHLRQDVDWVRTPQQALNALTTSKNYGAILINTEIFTKKKIETVNQLRAIGCHSPVIYIADLIHTDARFPIPESKKTIVIEKPVSSKDLQGLIERAQHANSFHTRYNKRFPTFEKGQIEVFRNGRKFDCYVRNLSVGGAFIETSETFLAGEILKVNIQLDEVSKSHEMSGKVVWNSNHPHYNTGGVTGVGLRFVRPGEVYAEAVHLLQ
jgi:Tfp pilus assembly protein PilZ